ncbi:ATP-binding SpoIIE family protein phosphatase [Noviherbaspirillum sp.]|uniref:ATP-binding SpoIIE family protein phosphatase n=1 Tax=Noviherbaspirillum sp. TaxID=1926288 RepID=UPI002FE1C97C
MESLLNIPSRQAVFPIGELGEVSAARRAGVSLARRLGFDETIAGRLALLITESATNIVKHATRGQIILRVISQQSRDGIEVIALDSGPGITNLASSMRDGTSTAGTYGVGLGAIRRLSDDFDIYTGPGRGTIVWMQLWKDAAGNGRQSLNERNERDEWEVGVICLPLASEDECGDDWEVVHHGPGSLSVMVADGLGHGPDAARASRGAVNVILQSGQSSPAKVLHDAHAALNGTRGAAVAVACISTLSGQLHFAGVGNVEARILDGDAGRNMVSHNGIVGSNLRKVQEFAFPWLQESMLVMHSDGLGTRWNLANYPGLSARHPALVAAVLYRDFARSRDDVAVLALRRAVKYQPDDRKSVP